MENKAANNRQNYPILIQSWFPLAKRDAHDLTKKRLKKLKFQIETSSSLDNIFKDWPHEIIAIKDYRSLTGMTYFASISAIFAFDHSADKLTEILSLHEDVILANFKVAFTDNETMYIVLDVMNHVHVFPPWAFTLPSQNHEDHEAPTYWNGSLYYRSASVDSLVVASHSGFSLIKNVTAFLISYGRFFTLYKGVLKGPQEQTVKLEGLEFAPEVILKSGPNKSIIATGHSYQIDGNYVYLIGKTLRVLSVLSFIGSFTNFNVMLTLKSLDLFLLILMSKSGSPIPTVILVTKTHQLTPLHMNTSALTKLPGRLAYRSSSYCLSRLIFITVKPSSSRLPTEAAISERTEVSLIKAVSHN